MQIAAGNHQDSLTMLSGPPSPPTTDDVAVPKKKRLKPLVLSHFAFAAWWMFLVLLHSGCAAFLIAAGQLYWYLENPYLSYYANLLAPPEQRQFKLCGTLMILLGVVHVVELLFLIVVSVRARGIVMPTGGFSDVTLLVLKRFLVRPNRVSSDSQPAATRWIDWNKLLDHATDLLSVESKHFWRVFMVREVVVLVVQVIQCYSYSSRIARPWINDTLVGLVVANCTLIALIYFAFRRHDRTSRRTLLSFSRLRSTSTFFSNAPLARMLCHVVDCVLTIGTGMALPIAVVMPYVVQYIPGQFTFKQTLLYGNTAFTNLVRENQALFARSLLDIGYKMVPHMSIYMCLMVVASILRSRVEPSTRQKYCVPSSTTEKSTDSGRDTKSKPPALSKNDSGGRVKQVFVSSLLLSLGVFVVVVHGRAYFHEAKYAASSDAAVMCAQPIYPWFASGYSCAVIEYNCYRHGVDTPPSGVFDDIDPGSVSSVIFTHCPALIVPSAIRTFTNLFGMELYNCTLVEWGVDAALSGDLHTSMVFLFMAHVNMTGLPAGILQKPFPSKLGDIELSMTNLTTVPAAVTDVWSGVGLVYLEHSQLTEIPTPLLEIPALSELSLIGNSIKDIPDGFSDDIKIDAFYTMALSSNPIRTLPETLRSGLTFAYLSLESTDIEVLPSWASTKIKESLYAYGSPVCSSESSNTDATVKTACSQRDDRGGGRFPLAVVGPSREL